MRRQCQERKSKVTLYKDDLTFSANREMQIYNHSDITKDEVQGQTPYPPVGMGPATTTFKNSLALPGKAENMPSYSPQVHTHVHSGETVLAP